MVGQQISKTHKYLLTLPDDLCGSPGGVFECHCEWRQNSAASVAASAASVAESVAVSVAVSETRWSKFSYKGRAPEELAGWRASQCP